MIEGIHPGSQIRFTGPQDRTWRVEFEETGRETYRYSIESTPAQAVAPVESMRELPAFGIIPPDPPPGWVQGVFITVTRVRKQLTERGGWTWVEETPVRWPPQWALSWPDGVGNDPAPPYAGPYNSLLGMFYRDNDEAIVDVMARLAKTLTSTRGN